MRIRNLVPLIPLAVASLALAACGSSSSSNAAQSNDASSTSAGSSTTAAADAFPATVTAQNGAVTIAAKPEKIVSLSPTATEMLFAIGAGSQVTAVDDQSNYPKEAPTTSLSGYQPNAEAIAGYDPDLVVMSDSSVLKELDKLKIPVLVEPAAATLADSYDQIADLGAATGHRAEASALELQMQTDIKQIVATVPHRPTTPTYYHELDDTYYTATSKTFIGSLYSMAGLANIADAAKDSSGSGYPQLSAEYIVQQNPTFIFLADTKCCHQSAATVAKRAGWSTMDAVKQGHVVELDDDIASRWGPRVVDLLRTIVDATKQA
jgi:iron complex transport system substrate-binding protein